MLPKANITPPVRFGPHSHNDDYGMSAPGAGQPHTWGVKAVGGCSYAWFRAWTMSAIRSDGCSIPIDSRIVESRTPIFWRKSAGTPEWVMPAGRLASDSV